MKTKYTELYQQMPRLPLPELETTIPQLIEWVKPYLSFTENQIFQKEALAFLQNDGQLLQAELAAHAATLSGSWLAPL